MIVGSLFILNMFVGIVINVFTKEKEELEMNHILTATQRSFCECMILCYNKKPDIKFTQSGNTVVDACYQMAIHWAFNQFVFVCIFFNTVALCLTWYDEPSSIKPVLSKVNIGFNIIYTIEFIIKYIGMGNEYFADPWNNFDCTIVAAAWLGMIATYFGLKIGALAQVLRSFRISRIFKIIRRYKSLRVLFNTFIDALPQLTNVGGLLFLFLFLYSVLGVTLFAKVKLSGELDIHANFKTFPKAFKTLFRMSTGESWHELMYAAGKTRSIIHDCVDDMSYEMYVENDMETNECG